MTAADCNVRKIFFFDVFFLIRVYLRILVRENLLWEIP